MGCAGIIPAHLTLYQRSEEWRLWEVHTSSKGQVNLLYQVNKVDVLQRVATQEAVLAGEAPRMSWQMLPKLHWPLHPYSCPGSRPRASIQVVPAMYTSSPMSTIAMTGGVLHLVLWIQGIYPKLAQLASGAASVAFCGP